MIPGNPPPGTALVIGATGAFGNPVTAELLRRGWKVKALRRSAASPLRFFGASATPTEQLTVVQGDALSADDVLSAARGSDIIVHAFNVRYPQWHQKLMPAAENVAAASEKTGALVVFPGNVYVLGADFTRPLAEDSTRDAVSVKGQLRNRVEARLTRATRSGARLLIVRAGDFFGPSAGSTSWLPRIVNPPLLPNTLADPAPRDVLHEWVFLPDLARVCVDLIEARDKLDAADVFHVSGYQVTSQQFMAALQNVLGPRKVRAMPWRLLRWLAVFSPLLREALELKYLWDKPVLLDDSKLRRFLGDLKMTPLETALRTTLEHSGSSKGHLLS